MTYPPHYGIDRQMEEGAPLMWDGKSVVDWYRIGLAGYWTDVKVVLVFADRTRTWITPVQLSDALAERDGVQA